MKRTNLEGILGTKFYRLTAKEYLGRINNKERFLFECECGKLKELNLVVVQRKNCTKSCGCLGREKSSIKGKNNNYATKYKYNEDFFKIPSEEHSYFLGLLYTDGWLQKTRNSISIFLQNKDSYILEDFSKLIGYNKPLYTNKRGKTFNISNKNIYNDLLNLGLYPNKTKTISPPINYLNDKDFWRGCIDGDGHLAFQIKSNNLILGFAGTIAMVQSFYIYCNQFIKTKRKIRIDKFTNNGNFARFTLSGKNAYIIGSILYNNSNFFIKRKKDSLEEFKNYYMNFSGKREIYKDIKHFLQN